MAPGFAASPHGLPPRLLSAGHSLRSMAGLVASLVPALDAAPAPGQETACSRINASQTMTQDAAQGPW